MTTESAPDRRTATESTAPGQPKKKRPPRTPRADFTIKSQLIAKLGPGGYGNLLRQLEREAGA